MLQNEIEREREESIKFNKNHVCDRNIFEIDKK